MHDRLRDSAETIVKTSYEMWRQSRDVQSLGFAWLTGPIKTDDGAIIKDMCCCILSRDEPEQHAKTMSAMAIKVEACAILLLRKHDMKIEAFFESPIGATYFEIPIRRSADALVLGDLVKEHDGRRLGVMWRRNIGQA